MQTQRKLFRGSQIFSDYTKLLLSVPLYHGSARPFTYQYGNVLDATVIFEKTVKYQSLITVLKITD